MGIIRPTNDAIWYYYWSLVVDMFRIELISEHKCEHKWVALIRWNRVIFMLLFRCTTLGLLRKRQLRSFLSTHKLMIYFQTCELFSQTCELLNHKLTENYLRSILETILNTSKYIFGISTRIYKPKCEVNFANIS